MARDLGVEYGAIYRITGPDGTIAVFNDPSSPFFAGVLDTEAEAVTGLERAGVRENAENIPEADGGRHGSFYRERLPFTLKGFVDTGIAGPNPAAQSRILRATNALRADGLLEWWPSTIAEGVRVLFREQQPTRITGRRPKSFLIAGVSADPFAYSRVARAGTIDPGASSNSGGIVSPLVSPLVNVVAPGGQLLALNDGNADTFPTIILHGPLLNPTVTNVTTGEVMVFDYGLAVGELMVLETHPRRRSIRVGSSPDPALTANRHRALNWQASRWVRLAPGVNDLRLSSPSYSAGALLELESRDAWG